MSRLSLYSCFFIRFGYSHPLTSHKLHYNRTGGRKDEDGEIKISKNVKNYSFLVGSKHNIPPKWNRLAEILRRLLDLAEEVEAIKLLPFANHKNMILSTVAHVYTGFEPVEELTIREGILWTNKCLLGWKQICWPRFVGGFHRLYIFLKQVDCTWFS